MDNKARNKIFREFRFLELATFFQKKNPKKNQKNEVENQKNGDIIW